MTSTEGMLELAWRGRSDFACLFGKRNCKHQQCWQQFVADFALMVLEEAQAELPREDGLTNYRKRTPAEVAAAVRARMEKG